MGKETETHATPRNRPFSFQPHTDPKRREAQAWLEPLLQPEDTGVMIARKQVSSAQNCGGPPRFRGPLQVPGRCARVWWLVSRRCKFK